MKDVRLTMSIGDFKTLLIWAQDHKEDSPETQLLWNILYGKVQAMKRREDYTAALKSDAV